MWWTKRTEDSGLSLEPPMVQPTVPAVLQLGCSYVTSQRVV